MQTFILFIIFISLPALSVQSCQPGCDCYDYGDYSDGCEECYPGFGLLEGMCYACPFNCTCTATSNGLEVFTTCTGPGYAGWTIFAIFIAIVALAIFIIYLSMEALLRKFDRIRKQQQQFRSNPSIEFLSNQPGQPLNSGYAVY